MRRLHSAELDKMREFEIIEEMKTYKESMVNKYGEKYYNSKTCPTQLERAYLSDLLKRATLLKPQRALTVVDGDLGEGPAYNNRSIKDTMEYEYQNQTRVMGADRSYRAMFHPGKSDIKLEDGGFRDSAEFFNVIDSGRYDPRLQARAAMVEGIPSSGGFSVPQQYIAEWLDAALKDEIARKYCKVIPMKGESLKISGWKASDYSSGAFAGLTMEFLAEGAVGTKQTALMREITLNANLAAIYIDASVELVSDGANFAENLESAMIKAISHGIDRHLIGSAGTGAGKPMSVLNSACNISVEGEVGQSSGTVTYSNLTALFARQLNPQSARWLANPTTIPQLLELSITGGVSASHVPAMTESNGEFRILGRPVHFSSVIPSLGSAGCISFVDFDFYALGLRSDAVIETTMSHRWTQREKSFRILLRFDAQSTLDVAITPEFGDSLSPIVSLEAIT